MIKYKLQEKKDKKHKHMEIKQYICKSSTGYERNKKMPRYKCQWKHDDSKPMGCSKSSSEREFYSNTILPQETRKALNRQPIFMPKTTGERRRTTAHTHTHTHTHN